MSLENAIKDIHSLTASAIKMGALQERHRIVDVVAQHIQDCNYILELGEECDVCAWAKDTIEKIKEGTDE
jgi:hypothetical protein